MTKNRKINALEFEYLTNLRPYVLENDKKAKKEVKYTLLNAVESLFGDKWHNLKDKTKEAIDYICMLSVERGFFWCSPQHIADKHNISKSTVYDALKQLREIGVLAKANRHSRKQNGLGCSMHFFTIHPYIDCVIDYLKVDWKANWKPYWKAENAETSTESKLEAILNIPTYLLPTSLPPLKESNMFINNINVNSEDKENSVKEINSNKDNNSTEKEHAKAPKKWVKYVPKEINELFATAYGDDLLPVWRKINQAYNSTKTNLTKEDMLPIAKSVLRFLVKNKRFNQMSVNELCAYVYKAIRDAIYNVVGTQFVMDMEKNDDGEWCYVDMDGYLVPTLETNRLDDYEILVQERLADTYRLIPSWLDDNSASMPSSNLNYNNHYIQEVDVSYIPEGEVELLPQDHPFMRYCDEDGMPF